MWLCKYASCSFNKARSSSHNSVFRSVTLADSATRSSYKGKAFNEQHGEIPMPAFASSEAMPQMKQEPEPKLEEEAVPDDKEVLLKLLAKPEMAELVKSLAANL